eukprot:g83090.t1
MVCVLWLLLLSTVWLQALAQDCSTCAGLRRVCTGGVPWPCGGCLPGCGPLPPLQGLPCSDQTCTAAAQSACAAVGRATCQPCNATCGNCLPGYLGLDGICQNIDDCPGHECLNGATCVDGVQSYSCKCVDGYFGDFCEKLCNTFAVGLIETCTACTSAGCTAGNCVAGFFFNTTTKTCTAISCDSKTPGYMGTAGACVCAEGYQPGPVRYAANAIRGGCCLPGWEGDNCEINIDECEVYRQPCYNGGTCIDGINSFTCVCGTYYQGGHCTECIQGCTPAALPTQCNDYACTPERQQNCSKLHFREKCNFCKTACGSCKAGYSEVPGMLTCDNDNDCANNQCKNGATCVEKYNNYSCNCVAGYSGTYCEIEINDCASNPCQNGVCIDLVNDFRCNCTAGYSGRYCQIDDDNCIPDPCQNGNCVDRVNDFLCNCKPGYSGRYCQTDDDDCLSKPCQNGVCIDRVNDFYCNCTAGYSGRLCNNDDDDCVPEPCQNGVCIDLVNDFKCDCTPGYSGRYCETDDDDCIEDPCENGICVDRVNDFHCNCTPGYSGRFCAINDDNCMPNPCKNGMCVDLVNDYRCDCLDGWLGKNCSEEDETFCLERFKQICLDLNRKPCQGFNISCGPCLSGFTPNQSKTTGSGSAAVVGQVGSLVSTPQGDMCVPPNEKTTIANVTAVRAECWLLKISFLNYCWYLWAILGFCFLVMCCCFCCCVRYYRKYQYIRRQEEKSRQSLSRVEQRLESEVGLTVKEVANMQSSEQQVKSIRRGNAQESQSALPGSKIEPRLKHTKSLEDGPLLSSISSPTPSSNGVSFNRLPSDGGSKRFTITKSDSGSKRNSPLAGGSKRNSPLPGDEEEDALPDANTHLVRKKSRERAQFAMMDSKISNSAGAQALVRRNMDMDIYEEREEEVASSSVSMEIDGDEQKKIDENAEGNGKRTRNSSEGGLQPPSYNTSVAGSEIHTPEYSPAGPGSSHDVYDFKHDSQNLPGGQYAGLQAPSPPQRIRASKLRSAQYPYGYGSRAVAEEQRRHHGSPNPDDPALSFREDDQNDQNELPIT